jgi:hypothetical protein
MDARHPTGGGGRFSFARAPPYFSANPSCVTIRMQASTTSAS